MRKIVAAVITTLGVCCGIFAADLDLAGVSQTVSSLAGYANVVNTGGAATLTLNLSADETFTGTISGDIKLFDGQLMLVNHYADGFSVIIK